MINKKKTLMLLITLVIEFFQNYKKINKDNANIELLNKIILLIHNK